jgi:hypothetical protein
MIDRSLRTRASRLLRDSYQAEDLTTLLLALRQFDGIGETLKEVGDFVAHRVERNKGIVTKGVQDFFVSTRFHFPRIVKASPIDLTDLPADIVAAMWATFRRTDSREIKKKTGLKRQDAEKALSALEKRVIILGGRRALAWPTETDIVLIKFLACVFVSKPAFDDRKLHREFVDALVQKSLIEAREAGRLASIRAPLALYTVACMHECHVDLGDGTHAKLAASPGIEDKEACIQVIASFKVISDGKAGQVMFPIFRTDIPPKDGCNPDIWLPGDEGVWDCSIEFKSNRRLGELT